MKKINFITVTLTAICFFGMTLWIWFGNKAEYSESERRMLAKKPELTAENIISGEYAKKFEEYAVDAFPMRDMWRTIKVYTRTSLLAQKDNHGIYTVENHIAKFEYPMNIHMLDHAIEVFGQVNENYLKDNRVYFSVIPDKNHYLAKDNGYLSVDYGAFAEYMRVGMDFAEYIEISDLLDDEDYYYTDTHWRQEAIVDVAERIGSAMGVDVSQEYKENNTDIPFYGVYMGQSALVHEPDELKYLTSDIIDRVVVDGATQVYDMKKAKGRDPYEMFLSGNQSVVTIRDEENQSGRRLIIFRDSFGSSIAPLLTKGYSEIVLVDLRYVSSAFLGEFVDFEGADVLFLYSTLLLNNSLSLR